MYTTEELYERLSKGESPDAIAQEFLDALNEARTRYDSKQTKRRDMAIKINNDIKEYFKEFLPSYDYDLTPRDIEDIMDNLEYPTHLFSQINQILNEIVQTE